MTKTSSRDLLDSVASRLERVDFLRVNGRVAQVVGLVLESEGPDVQVGDLCEVRFRRRDTTLRAEVVGFRGDRVLLMPLGDIQDIGPGCDVVALGRTLGVHVGPALLGRVLDGLGRPMDGLGPVVTHEYYPLHAPPPHPLRRQGIDHPLSVGVRVMDGLLTLGRGQRLGIFAGSGVGKSTLLGMMARYTEADVNVIGLVGERGREVKEFMDRDLGPEGVRRSVVVVATSDQPPLVRLKAALTATAVAEYFRDQGASVLLMMDSVTRVAMAQRDVGLAVGEPPATRGYTPSVFAFLPRLLERAGAGERGSITGIYNVLVEGDDMNEPVADAARAILDGHVVLSRALSDRGHYPPVDVLASVSRLMPQVASAEHRRAAARLREALGALRAVEDLVRIGAYAAGSDAAADEALARLPRIEAFLRQATAEAADLEATVRQLQELWA